MRRRIELRETVIAPGAIVRLKKEHAPSLKDLMARWRVTAKFGGLVDVYDVEDCEDVRTLELEKVERVSGGEEGVVGYTWIAEDDTPVADANWADESYVEDYSDGDADFEYPSLFDDPIALQREEDDEDPDAVDDEDEDAA